SSRSRHTRSIRDWSSDVCSSDLSFRSHLVQLKQKYLLFSLRKKHLLRFLVHRIFLKYFYIQSSFYPYKNSYLYFLTIYKNLAKRLHLFKQKNKTDEIVSLIVPKKPYYFFFEFLPSFCNF